MERVEGLTDNLRHTKNWFVLSFAELDVNDFQSIKKFVETWKVENPTMLGRFIGYLLLDNKEPYNKNHPSLAKKQQYEYLDFHELVFPDGEPNFRWAFEEEVQRITCEEDAKVISAKREICFSLVLEIKSYIEKFSHSQKIKQKYTTMDKKLKDYVVPYLKSVSNKVNKSVDNNEIDHSYNESLECLASKYPEIVEKDKNEFLKEYMLTKYKTVYYIEPLGDQTESFNERLHQIPFGFFDYVEEPTGKDGLTQSDIAFKKAGLLVEDFESFLFYDLFLYIQNNFMPITCSYCEKWISDPSNKQIDQAKKGVTVLHKNRNKETSSCERDFKREKEKLRKRKERSLNSEGEI